MGVRVRIRLGSGRNSDIFRKRRRWLRTIRNGMASTSAAALLFAVWCLASDLNWIGPFAIPPGPLSHWQVWLAVAVLIEVLRYRLRRYARGGGGEVMP